MADDAPIRLAGQFAGIAADFEAGASHLIAGLAKQMDSLDANQLLYLAGIQAEFAQSLRTAELSRRLEAAGDSIYTALEEIRAEIGRGLGT